MTNDRVPEASAERNPKRCAPPGDVSLPIAGGPSGGAIKKSAMGPRRAAALIAVHVLMAAHLLHYVFAERTLSPIEPSEAMYTLRDGQINAGFIFFAVALLATLIFGRFACGWGCHLVAYQDLCGWIMKKLSVRPQPFRSRLLVFAPLGLALYMFVYPSVYRLLFPSPQTAFPGFSNHLTTDAFWKTFPGPVFAVLTLLVCGFAAVYFLGAKGFCTYGCPYGGFFGLLDSFSPGKILVNDDCAQCGHCTATCTSNVRVHEEVALYGRVVDPGCMKCMDCVSVCPNGALRFGFTNPLAGAGGGSRKRPRRHDFSMAEELLLAVVFLSVTFAFRGLYDGPPLLMSVGLGGITAYLALKMWRLWRDPTVRIQNIRIKTAGRMGLAGWGFALVTALWLGFAAHSGLMQWHRQWGRYHLARTEVTQEEMFSRRSLVEDEHSSEHRRAAARCFSHFSAAERWGLFSTAEVKLGLAWMYLLRGEDESAEARMRDVVTLSGGAASHQAELAKVLALQGRWEEAGRDDALETRAALIWMSMLTEEFGRAERLARSAIMAYPEHGPFLRQLAAALAARGDVLGAIESFEALIGLVPGRAEDHLELAELLIAGRRVDDAVEHLRSAIGLNPDSGRAYYNLGALLGRSGRFAEAIEQLEHAAGLLPDDADTQIELGLACAASGRVEDGIEALERAEALQPENPLPRRYIEMLRDQLGEAPH